MSTLRNGCTHQPQDKHAGDMNAERAQGNFLRLLAIIQMLTFAVVLMPLEWIASWHAWLGVGVMPDDPVLRYVIRGAALAQAAIGVLLWVIATDVVRFRPLVVATATIYLIGAPAYYWIDATAGMPHFWCIFDCAFCFFTGGVLMTLCLLSARNKSPQTTKPLASLNKT
jgi:hypothetical protein